MIDNKDKSSPNPKPIPNPTPFEKRGSKEVPPASYNPPIKVPKQPKSK